MFSTGLPASFRNVTSRLQISETEAVCVPVVEWVAMTADNADAYDRFADFYATGGYTLYSERMADRFEQLLSAFSIEGERVLDVACGEGSFAVELARQGYDVTGFDVSTEMIEHARGAASDAGVSVGLAVADARRFDPSELPEPGVAAASEPDRSGRTGAETGRFDIATAWFDSVNHLLTEEAVEAAFERIATALGDEGAFVFDVNPPKRLARLEDRERTVARNTEERFEAYTDVSYDETAGLLSVEITCFERTADGWKRFVTQYRERGYEIETLRQLLRTAGFDQITVSGSPVEQIDATDSERIYAVAKILE